LRDFRDELSNAIGKNLVGIYMHGSIAFPDYQPSAGDLDFYVVVRKPLDHSEIIELDHVHRRLAARFASGERLDGFYIPRAKARRTAIPKGLVYGSHGRIHKGGSDNAWALHREHFHGNAYIRVQGPKATNIFPTADWPSLRSALYRQLVYSRSIIDSDPWWSVLNLCRLVYTFRNGRVVVSKLGAAKWALENLPAKWAPLIRSSVRIYKQAGKRRVIAGFKREARRFLGFASVRVIAFDTVWDKQPPHIAHLRKKAKIVVR
jgi:Domain of unknown function (DUF4111)